MKKNIQTMKEDIKLKVQEQKIAKANRKTVQIQVERTMSPTEAYFKSIKLKEELRHMYLAYGVLRGKTPEVIEQNAKTPYNKDWVKRITEKYELSQHAAASTLSRAGRNGCAKCHGHEGFVETTWTGRDTTATSIPIPTRIACSTCHDFHMSLDFENDPNHAIRKMDEVKLMTQDATVGFTNVESNLCMNCHQSRHAQPDNAVGTAITEVGGHFGPHHGPQANFINGLNGYEFGAALSVKGPHETSGDCIQCHMYDDSDDAKGGHNWVPGEEGCLACHAATDSDRLAGVVSDIHNQLVVLQGLLDDAGLLEPDTATDGTISFHPNPGIYDTDAAGSLWNYLIVEEDKSGGVHNPDYAEVLLANAILKMTPAR
jgi:hypothetical protein